MAAIHLLRTTTHGHLECLLHFFPPSGDNVVGVSWKDAAIAAGIIGNTADPEGDPAEATDIEAGNIVEIRVVLPARIDGKTAPEQQAILTLKASIAQDKWVTEQQVLLKRYGYTQGTVS